MGIILCVDSVIRLNKLMLLAARMRGFIAAIQAYISVSASFVQSVEIISKVPMANRARYFVLTMQM